MLKKIIPILLCLFLFGCMNQTRYTTTLPNMGTGTYQQTQSFLIERLTSLGWRIFTRQTRLGHIVAANNETAILRDVVLLDFTPDNDISLWIRSEIRISSRDAWVKPSTVCDGYTWSREQRLLTQLLNQ